jgi:hypothetical protein
VRSMIKPTGKSKEPSKPSISPLKQRRTTICGTVRITSIVNPNKERERWTVLM